MYIKRFFQQLVWQFHYIIKIFVLQKSVSYTQQTSLKWQNLTDEEPILRQTSFKVLHFFEKKKHVLYALVIAVLRYTPYVFFWRMIKHIMLNVNKKIE